MSDRVLVPLSGFLTELLPAEWVEATPEVFQHIALDPDFSSVDWGHRSVSIRYHLVILQPVGLELPLIPGFSVHLGQPGAFPDFFATVTTEPVIRVGLEGIDLTLHVPPSVLQAWRRDESGRWEKHPDVDGYTLTLTTAVDVNLEGDIDLATPEVTEAGPAMIGDTWLILELSGVRVIAGGVPSGLRSRVPAGFKGVWIREGTVDYHKSGTDIPGLHVADAAIGRGGFTGTLALGVEAADLELEDAQLRGEADLPDDAVRAEVVGMEAVLLYFSVTFDQSVPVASRITGYAHVPFVDDWTRFEASIGGANADFMLELGGIEDQSLISLEHDGFEIEADRLRYFTEDGVHYAEVDGRIRPKLGGIDWPWLQAEGLTVSSEGRLAIDGVGLELRKAETIDFHGFQLSISAIGVGQEEETVGGETVTRQSFTLSGGIRLIDGLPVAASVKGLEISWRTTGDPDVRVTLEGVGVKLEVPGTLRFEGEVAYVEVPPATEGGSPRPIFEGAVAVELIALKTGMEGELIVGRLEDAAGETFTSLYLALNLRLSSPLPIAASGADIYAFAGLFGMHIAPDVRDLCEETVPCFAWYKADLGGDSGFSATSIHKWTPERGSFAIGAGVTVGTVFDSGYALSVYTLVAFRLPGPVVFFEGRGDLLAPLGQEGADSGAFYALAVFDGNAGTAQFNLELQWTIPVVLSLQAGLEAFFDFNQPARWHLHLGKREPKSKRVQAKIVSIFEVQFYLMVDHAGIQTGSHAGYHLERELGPVALVLRAGLTHQAGIFWSPSQFEGLIDIVGEAAIEVFGIGLGLGLRLCLEGTAATPFRVHGLAEISLTLPWPLPDVSAKLELSYVRREAPEPVSPFLEGASLSHAMLEGSAFPVADSAEGAPVVPVDAEAMLSFSRPLQGRSVRRNEDGAFVVRGPDPVDAWAFAYRYDEVRLIEDPDGPGERVVMLYPFRSDVTGVRPFDFSEESLLRGPDAEAPHWRLWTLERLNGTTRWREGWTEAYPACGTGARPQTRCVDWHAIADGTVYRSTFAFQRLRVVARGIPSVQAGRLRVQEAWVRLPEPAGWIEVTLEGPAVVKLYHRGALVAELPFVSGDGLKTRALEAVVDAVWIEASQGSPLDLSPGYARIDHVCYRPRGEVEAERRRDEHEERPDEAPGSSHTLPLKPDTLYRLEAVAGATITHEGETRDAPRERRSFYFRTGHGPGANASDVGAVAGLVPGGDGDGRAGGRGEDGGTEPRPWTAGPLNRLETYLAGTVPAHGARQFYRGHDLVLEFSRPYVRAMYRPEKRLEIDLKDRNGQRLGAQGEWSSGLLPLLSPGLLTWMAAREREGCAVGEAGPLEPRPAVRRGGVPAMRPRALYTAEVWLIGGETDRVLHTFQFAISRFADIGEHLRSGGREGGPTVREWPGDVPAEAGARWSDAVGAVKPAWRALERSRRGLRTAIDGGSRLTAAEELAACRRDLETLRGVCTEHFPALCQGFGLEPARALPPVLEVVTLSIPGSGADTAGSRALLVESPEPLEWARITVTATGPGVSSPVTVRALWHRDGTQAFLMRTGGDGGFVPGTWTLTMGYPSGDAPDLPPATIDGADALESPVVWRVEMG